MTQSDVRTNETDELTDVVFPTVDTSDVGNAQGKAEESSECAAARHGTSTAYRANRCRCPEAKESQRLAQIRYKAVRAANGGPLLTDATGTIRRVQGLRRLGWTLEAIGLELGVSPQRVDQYGTRANEKVHVDVARAVAAAYDRLSMRLGPSSRARGYAERAGWAFPLAWDDDTIDDPGALPWTESAEGRDPLLLDDVAISRRLGGDVRVRLSAAEKREALRRGLARGMSENELLRNLKMSWQSAAAAKTATNRQTARAS